MTKNIQGSIDAIITIDTTPSMQRVQNLARKNAEKLVADLLAAMPSCRIGVIFNGDLSDDPQHGGPYVVAVLQPTANKGDIIRFIRETPSTYLARGNAAYQEVLWQLNSQIRWRPDAKRVAIMIGDTSANSVTDSLNKIRRDVNTELARCATAGIKIYAIQCQTGTRDECLWHALATRTGGVYFDLFQFDEVLTTIQASLFNEGGVDLLEEFIKFLIANGKYTRSMDNLAATLLHRAPQVGKSNLTPVKPGRFQILTISDEDCASDGKIAIKAFVEAQGFKFEKGRGFYELGRAETIQDYKEIVVMDRNTGDFFTGEANIRALLNVRPLPPGSKEKIKLSEISGLDKYRIFIQSMSVNRKLVSGAMFLYNIEGLVTN